MDKVDVAVHYIKSAIKITLLSVVFIFMSCQIYNHNWIGSISAFISLLWIIISFKLEISEMWFKVHSVFAMGLMLVGLSGALYNSKISDVENRERIDHLKRKSRSLTLPNSYCPSLVGYQEKTMKYENLKSELLDRCHQQYHADLWDFFIELYKIENTGPVSGLIIEMFAVLEKKEKVRTCESVAIEINQLCPELNL